MTKNISMRDIPQSGTASRAVRRLNEQIYVRLKQAHVCEDEVLSHYQFLSLVCGQLRSHRIDTVSKPSQLLERFKHRRDSV